ncbi:MAG: hypothetical protein JNM84_08790 [Planctomycetes bacterium]|nr:hypothetical protein [Planctomycetota bacterium]
MSDPGLIDRYGWRLGFAALDGVVGLGEGRTPLVSAEVLLAPSGYRGELYFHLDFVAPHGSYRDRGAAVAVSAAKRDRRSAIAPRFDDERSRAVVSAYAARAGVSILAVGDDAAGAEALTLDESSETWRAGLATSAWDVFDQLGGRAPEHHYCASLELVRALGEGYAALRREGCASSVPRLELASATPSERGHAALLRLGVPATATRAAAVEAVLAALDEQRFQAPEAVVLSLPE